jgi:hypothetical protein
MPFARQAPLIEYASKGCPLSDFMFLLTRPFEPDLAGISATISDIIYSSLVKNTLLCSRNRINQLS